MQIANIAFCEKPYKTTLKIEKPLHKSGKTALRSARRPLMRVNERDDFGI